MKTFTWHLTAALCLLAVGLSGCRSLPGAADPAPAESAAAVSGTREESYTLSLPRPQLPESAGPGTLIPPVAPLPAGRMDVSLERDMPAKAAALQPSHLPRLPAQKEERRPDRPLAGTLQLTEFLDPEAPAAVRTETGAPARPPAVAASGPKPPAAARSVPAAAMKPPAAEPKIPAAAPRPPAEAAKPPAAEPKIPAAAPRPPVEAAKPPAASPSIAPAANVPASAPAAAAASSPEQSHRRLLARTGDQISLDLPGKGWIFLGTKAEPEAQGVQGAQSARSAQGGTDPGVAFLSQKQSAGMSSFIFRAEQIGGYQLLFQHQDNARAVLRHEVVHLQVLPEEEFLQRLGGQAQALPSASLPHAPLPETAAAPALDRAEKLLDMGEHELALIEFQKAYRQGDAHLTDRLAACFAAGGEHLAASKYYRQNLGAGGEYGDRAVLGLVRSSLALGDAEQLVEVLPSLFALQGRPIEGELLEVARFQSSRQRYPAAIRALEEYLDRYPCGGRLDEVYYRLAQIHEADSPNRDLRKARDYYRLVYQQFPESRFADIALQRIRYLDRYFFLVQ